MLLLVVLKGLGSSDSVDISDLIDEVRLLLRFKSHYVLLLGLLLELLFRHTARRCSTQLFIESLNILASTDWFTIRIIIHLAAV